MSHLDILLPFGLPPAELAADLLRECKTPALAALLAYARSPQSRTFDVFSRHLPHEAWLARHFMGIDSLSSDTSPPVAAAALQQFGLPAEPGKWFILTPVHIHIARDHLVLTDVRQLELTEQEAKVVFDAAQPLFEEMGKTLLYGDATTWFVRSDDWGDLQTSSPDAACGHNIDIWMPKGTNELGWRKLQNEVQMLWHTHAVNAEREERGARPVNSLWLWGGSPAQPTPIQAPYRDLFNLHGWTRAFGQSDTRQAHAQDAGQVLAAQSDSALVLLDALVASALSNDWGRWLQQMQALEAAWFAPLLAALKAGQIKQLKLILAHSSRSTEFTLQPSSLRKFWVKPSLARLLP